MGKEERKKVRDQQYPDFFPAGCPPEDAHTEELLLFRFCSGIVPQEDDFISYFMKKPEKYNGVIQAYGLSVMRSRKDCLAAFRRFPRMRNYHSIASGMTNDQRGSWKETPSRQNPAHITWWVCKDVKPLTFFTFDEIIGDET